MNGINKDVNSQVEILENILNLNENIEKVLKVSQIEFDHYYVGAGSLVQTVWNYLSGYPLNYGISDIDIIYFDDKDLTKEKEEMIEQKLASSLSDLPLEIDVKNEARVHLWYKKKFGKDINPYQSLEDAINSWPTTATALGVRREDDGEFKVYAPYGLNDLFSMTVRANKQLITRDIYEAKATKWLNLWPKLTVIPWENE
ncbi:nucleotidyltransferase family protein [Alkalihalobacillus macyae]|uniref:nucleotidyltransferase family protein n=1 Tax=Guptibacillus hwajinpoensis TaxID=208199 RepID=UPI00273C3A81|nr:nucleotidyltransferase family protein [Alkalihalobacillus macyae]MDP4549576.1 nucleotidyltransferase family protein [Alkalihalobacillus macyae]